MTQLVILTVRSRSQRALMLLKLYRSCRRLGVPRLATLRLFWKVLRFNP